MTDSQKLDLLLTEIQGMKSEMQGMKGDIQSLKGEMQGMKGDIQSLKGEMQGMRSDIEALKDNVQKLEKKVTGLELHLENVTDRSIRFIAEGHLDLDRKLNDALKAEQLKEWYYIRTNVMDDEIRKIKERLTEIA